MLEYFCNICRVINHCLFVSCKNASSCNTRKDLPTFIELAQVVNLAQFVGLAHFVGLAQFVELAHFVEFTHFVGLAQFVSPNYLLCNSQTVHLFSFFFKILNFKPLVNFSRCTDWF